MGWWYSVISRDGEADASERRDRETMMMTSAGMAVFAAGSVLSTMVQQFHLGILAGLLMGAVGVLGLLWGACKKRFTQGFVVVYISIACIAICMGDIFFYQADLQVAWPGFVCVVDLILVLRLDHRLAASVVCFVVLWLLVTFVERLTRFGLYDMPLTVSYTTRKEVFTAYVLDCDKPPCKSKFSHAATYHLMALVVFIVDFLATRGFAQQVMFEQAAMRSTIATVEEIASLLAAYDVDAVSRILNDDSYVLPEAMRAALLRLEQNLRAYRPYLPRSCLPCEQWVDGDVVLHDGVSDFESHDSPRSTESCGERRRALEVRHVQALSFEHVTLLAVNIKGSVQLLQEDMHSFERAFDETLSRTLLCVEQHTGIVDLFTGDHVWCSFNASRNCLMHATEAVGAAKTITFGAHALSVDVNAGAVTGRAYCGDIGCADMRRFSVVGALPAQAHAMERIGAALGLPVVCNKICQQDAECTHEMRMVPLRFAIVKAVGSKVTGDEADVHNVYEVIFNICVPSTRASSSGEWMYQLGYASSGWYGYNAAVCAYLRGDSMKAVLQLAGEKQEELSAVLDATGTHEVLSVGV